MVRRERRKQKNALRIGLIDVDSHNFPNLPLMKLSAWHKSQGDSVGWYEPLVHGIGEPLDRVYMSKVFSFTPDYRYFINAKEVVKGGSGYAIKKMDSRELFGEREDILPHYEVFDKSRDAGLPVHIEHIYPDYSLYPELTKDTAYGFMSRGCPRNCNFCHVAAKEGLKAHRVADLTEFWRGQKNIVLLDPNPVACPEWKDILRQLADSGAWVDFSQGVDIRLMTEEKAEIIKRIRTKNIHFAWDRYEDKDIIIPKLKEFKRITGWDKRKLTVYVLVNFSTTTEQDLERIYTLRDLGYWAYVMIYDREHTKPTDTVRRMQRWVNMRAVFEKTRRFEDYR